MQIITKQNTVIFKSFEEKRNPSLNILPILWIDTLVRGQSQFVQPPFTCLDLSGDAYAGGLLANAYPASTFYSLIASDLASEHKPMNIYPIPDKLPDESVHFIFLGSQLTFGDADEISSLFQMISRVLAPGGYVITSYESRVGWSKFQVVLDLLKEIVQASAAPLTDSMLIKVFFELKSLSHKHIRALGDEESLTRLETILNRLPEEVRDRMLRDGFKTYYPSHIASMFQMAHRFVGSFPIIKNYIKLGMSNEQKAFVTQSNDLLSMSQRQDLILMPFQRADIWQKHKDTHTPALTIQDFYLGCVSDYEHFPRNVDLGYVTLDFSDEIYVHLRRLLNKGFFTIDEIVNALKDKATHPQQIVDRLMLLVMADHVKYTLKRPLFPSLSKDEITQLTKISFSHSCNRQMFSDPSRFLKERGAVVHPEYGWMMPFDQRTSMVMAALSKVHESMVPAYCADIWSKSSGDHTEILGAEKDFLSALIHFKRYYLGKFLELGLINRVLIK